MKINILMNVTIVLFDNQIVSNTNLISLSKAVGFKESLEQKCTPKTYSLEIVPI